MSRVEVPQNTRICGKLNQSYVDKEDGNIVSKNGEQRNMPADQSYPLNDSSSQPEYLYEVKKKKSSSIKD